MRTIKAAASAIDGGVLEHQRHGDDQKGSTPVALKGGSVVGR